MTYTSLKEKAIKRWGGIEGQPRAFHQNKNGDCAAYVTISVDGIKPEGHAGGSRSTASCRYWRTSGLVRVRMGELQIRQRDRICSAWAHRPRKSKPRCELYQS